MKIGNVKRASLWLPIAIFTASFTTIELHSCKKADERISLHVYFAGKSTSLGLLPQQMTQLYYNIYQEQQIFDSCKVVQQINGFTIVVAMGTTNDGKTIKFAIIADKEEGFLSLRDKPYSSCACIGTCDTGCEPYYLGAGLGWECTKCEPSQLPDTECIKTETPNQPHPGGGNQ